MSTDTDKLRVGVVGVGYLGKFHAEKYARMADTRLVGVADIDAAAAAAVAENLKTAAFGRHTDLIGRVDAVSIVVPTLKHFRIAREFLENGVDVLIEKPMTATLAQADELVALAAARGLIIQVGHLERFNPAVVALRDIVKRPLFIESHRLSMFRGRATDVSVVLDLMIHDIDLISNFAQSDLVSVHAAGVPVVSGEVDIANARLEFDSGCVANVTASRISIKDERKIRLFQRECYTSVDFVDHHITVIRRKGEDPGGLIPGMDIQNISFSPGDALDDELKAFVQSVRTRRPPQVDGAVGRDALRIALDVMTQINAKIDRYLNR
ncbi:MAG: Gfo/Idh/MocA family oxidoreductase [Desulfobacterales bacterium]